MIRTCGIYAIKRDGVFNAPFVALNDEQAKKIVTDALDGIPEDFGVFDIYRIGTLDMFDGICSTESEIISTHGVDVLIDDEIKEEKQSEISETV